jgi:4-amino-4-deoxy-L-arabinose transferase-like glycosyltransferase
MEVRRIIRVNKETLLFLLVFVFAAALYLFNINFSEIWIDESFTKALVRHPYSEFFKLVADDFHPPLYFLGLKLFTSAVGLDNFTIRLFSVIGALCTLILGYTVGQKILGKQGALCYCLLLVALPMPVLYSHDARMYTWAAFMTTGVFLYALSFIKTNKTGDLIMLGVFSLMAAYTHYYCLIAAFWADAFVLLYLYFSQNKSWRSVPAMGVAVFVLYLPWFFVLLSQTRAAQKDFWIQAVSPSTLLSCYIDPFGIKYGLSVLSYPMAVIVYALTIIAVYKIFIARKDGDKTVLGLSLVIFNFTVLTAVVLSFALRPLLYSRYVMCVVTMLMVPPMLYFMGGGYKWLKAILMAALLCCGIYISIEASYFSFGPYKQSLDDLQRVHPDVKKIIHVSELTAGPFYEYGRDGPWRQYCVKNENSVWYTNMAVFDGYHAVKNLNEALQKDDIFCMVKFPFELNGKNYNLITSQCDTLSEETVADDKPGSQTKFLLYILKYRGSVQ